MCLELLQPPSRRDNGEELQKNALDLAATYRGYQKNRRKRRSWAADNPGNMAIRAELLAKILELAGEHLSGEGEVLDIGCGGGWLLAALVERGVSPSRLHGVDLIPSRVEAARKRLSEVEVRKADARELPFPDRSFSLVTLLTCLSSMPSVEVIGKALNEADRVLADTGVLLCYEPRIPNPFNRRTLRIKRSRVGGAIGPEVKSLRLTGFPPLARRLGRLTPRLYPVLSRSAPTHRLSMYTRQPG